MSELSLRGMLSPYERSRDQVDERIRDGIERYRKSDAATAASLCDPLFLYRVLDLYASLGSRVDSRGGPPRIGRETPGFGGSEFRVFASTRRRGRQTDSYTSRVIS